jgi:hypothetical protein
VVRDTQCLTPLDLAMQAYKGRQRDQTALVTWRPDFQWRGVKKLPLAASSAHGVVTSWDVIECDAVDQVGGTRVWRAISFVVCELCRGHQVALSRMSPG